MKTILLSVAFLLATSLTFAQNEKFIKAMAPKVMAVDTTFSPAGLLELSNSFERIADAEKTQWLPYYYAALTQVNAGYMQARGADIMSGKMAPIFDPLADRAEALLNKAEALSKDNSEIWAVRKMITSLRMMGNPMQRYKMREQADDELEMARKLNPDNPRVYYLLGSDKFNTPEQFGGSKEEGKKLFTIALEKYNTTKPDGPLAPHWGRGTVEYLLKAADNK
jgi:tetratricopeptide (TPR) repeat protein